MILKLYKMFNLNRYLLSLKKNKTVKILAVVGHRQVLTDGITGKNACIDTSFNKYAQTLNAFLLCKAHVKWSQKTNLCLAC